MTQPEPAVNSNGVRLSGRQWVGVLLFSIALILLLPPIWAALEPIEVGPDYRVPYDLSADYWLLGRASKIAAERSDILAVGDSVIWGEYVTREETLPAYLGKASGKKVANLGVNGLQPATMIGLLDSYAPVSGKKVLLHCNPLWMTSPRRDLSFEPKAGDDLVPLNHAALVPQFSPRIPSYPADMSQRLGFVVQRNVSFSAWSNHLQVAYFGTKSIPAWTMEHPDENPFGRITLKLPFPSDEQRHPGQKSWKESGGTRQTMEWVDLEASVQWRSFRQAVEILRRRGNQVFVLVGPFNEHMLTEAGLGQYRAIKTGIEAWLKGQDLPHWVPEVLPSELYPDASHPFAEGYERLARRLAGRPPL